MDSITFAHKWEKQSSERPRLVCGSNTKKGIIYAWPQNCLISKPTLYSTFFAATYLVAYKVVSGESGLKKKDPQIENSVFKTQLFIHLPRKEKKWETSTIDNMKYKFSTQIDSLNYKFLCHITSDSTYC